MNLPLRAALQAAIFVAACGAGPAVAGTGATAPAIVVHVKDFKYAPTPVVVHVGDTVTFVNDDDEAHTVTATDKSFDSKGLDSSDSWKHVFAKAGKFEYFCELHPYMKGTIVVLPAGSAS